MALIPEGNRIRRNTLKFKALLNRRLEYKRKLTENSNLRETEESLQIIL